MHHDWVVAHLTMVFVKTGRAEFHSDTFFSQNLPLGNKIGFCLSPQKSQMHLSHICLFALMEKNFSARLTLQRKHLRIVTTPLIQARSHRTRAHCGKRKKVTFHSRPCSQISSSHDALLAISSSSGCAEYGRHFIAVSTLIPRSVWIYTSSAFAITFLSFFDTIFLTFFHSFCFSEVARRTYPIWKEYLYITDGCHLVAPLISSISPT